MTNEELVQATIDGLLARGLTVVESRPRRYHPGDLVVWVEGVDEPTGLLVTYPPLEYGGVVLPAFGLSGQLELTEAVKRIHDNWLGRVYRVRREIGG